MKHYRPKFPAWQPIAEQVASRKNKQPSCYGHHYPRGILCGKCAWAEDCKTRKFEDAFHLDGSTANSQQGTPNDQ